MQNRTQVPRHEGQVSWPQRVDGKRFLGFAFAILDMMHGGRVHNHLGPNVHERTRDRRKIGDLNVGVCQPTNGIAIFRESDDQIAAELPVGADHGYLHG